MEAISRGEHGEAVRDVQRRLLGAGYRVDADELGGTFGASTEVAVREFQQARGLPVDGIVANETWGYAPTHAQAFWRPLQYRADTGHGGVPPGRGQVRRADGLQLQRRLRAGLRAELLDEFELWHAVLVNPDGPPWQQGARVLKPVVKGEQSATLTAPRNE